MPLRPRLYHLWRNLWHRDQIEQELGEEVEAYLQMVIEVKIRDEGLSPAEARRAAVIEIGGAEQVKEQVREVRMGQTLETIWQDVRYGARLLVKQPTFTLVAIVTLALGIGANTTIFSVINALLLKPLPFPEAERLVLLWESQANDPQSRNIVSAPNFQDWQRQSDVFASMAIFDSGGKGYNLSGGGEPEQVSGVRVSSGFFEVLGVKPRLGRTFLPDDETPGKHQVVVISDGLWRSRFQSDPTLPGKTIKVDGEDFTVVGVMPPEFEFQFWGGARQLWVPIFYTKGDRERGSHSFVSIARLKPGVTIEQASAQMNAVGLGLAEQYANDNAGKSVTVDPMGEFGLEDRRKMLLTLLAVAGSVLLIACVNVANLLMARGAARQREFAIRSALGASRGRTVRQLMTESLLLAFAGGISGTLIAIWSSNLLLKVLPGNLRTVPFRSVNDISIDVKVLAFTWVITCLTGIIFGLAPALLFSRRNANESLQEGSRGTTAGGGARLRHSLVILEIGLALVVLTGAGLMTQSMMNLLNVEPGLNPSNVLVMNMSLPQENTYYSPPAHPQFAHDLQEQVGSIPGVVAVSAISQLPIGGGMAGRSFVIEGRPDPGRENQPGASYSVICPDYFKTMGIRLLSGREFTEQDSQNAPGVIIINETMARRYWPDEDPIGKRIKIGYYESDGPWLTVVGLHQDVRQGGLDRPARAQFFRPYNQAAWPVMTVVVRTVSSPGGFINPVKQALARVEPDRAVSGIRTMDEVMASSLTPRRFPMLLLLAFSFIALTLAAVGISGVVSFSVSQRTREIGIRLALGARKGDVLRLVLNRSMGAAIMGIGLGLVGSFALTRFLTELLFEVKPMDPIVLAAVALILAAVAFLSSYLPARRATKVDPMKALRSE
jgi:putative ABC transport system permease protein